MRLKKKRNKKSVGQTNQCVCHSLHAAKCSAKSLPLVRKKKLRFYFKEVKATSGAIKVEVSIPKQTVMICHFRCSWTTDGKVKSDN